jgi:protein-S-isoprenylcysteine O-methyltransferase Ste14
MFDSESLRILDAAVIVGTLIGVLVLGWIVSRGRTHREHAVASQKQAPGAEPLWAVGSAVVQGWAVGGFVLPAYFYAWPAVPAFPGDRVLQLSGLVLWVGGLVLVDGSAWVLGRFLVSAAQVQANHRLVEEGPYHWIRHPMYTANVMMALGLGFFFLSPPLLLVACALALLANYRARLEEGLLRSPEAFGSVYDAYMTRTGRFLQRLRPV